MRILLVEDDDDAAAFLRSGFAAAGFLLDVAGNAHDAFERGLAHDCYDTILLDVMLPDLSGIELCRRWRQRGVQTLIMMVSGKGTVEDRIQGLNAGADDYLTKPFAFEELLCRVRALLRRHREFCQDAPLQAGDLTLDLNTHEVRRAGKLLALTPKEFALLEYLIRRANRVLTRSMIEEHVWGTRHVRMTNVVDVYIRRLRRKMGEGIPSRLIHTVRGFGYQLRP